MGCIHALKKICVFHFRVAAFFFFHKTSQKAIIRDYFPLRICLFLEYSAISISSNSYKVSRKAPTTSIAVTAGLALLLSDQRS